MFQPNPDAVRKITIFFTATVAERGVIGIDAEDAAHHIAGEDVPHLLRRVTGGIQSGEDGTHGRSGNHVDRDAVLFQPLDRSDLAHGDRGTPAESQSDHRPTLRQVGRSGSRVCRRET